jgi:hypothetical protein
MLLCVKLLGIKAADNVCEDGLKSQFNLMKALGEMLTRNKSIIVPKNYDAEMNKKRI